MPPKSRSNILSVSDHARSDNGQNYSHDAKRSGRRQRPREVDPFTALIAITDFIDHVLPGLRSAADIKAILVIWRKTLGWGLLSEQIGFTELATRTGVGKGVLKKRVQSACSVAGIIRQERTKQTAKGDTQWLRTGYEWPISERVRQNLEKAEKAKKREGSVEPPGWGDPDPQGGAVSTPTQLFNNCEPETPETITRHRGTTVPAIESSTRIDRMPDQKGTGDSPGPPYSEEVLSWMADAIGSYGTRRTMRQHMGAEPPNSIVRKSLDAADGTPLQVVAAILRDKCVRDGLDPGSSAGPRGWGWFPTIIADGIRSLRRREQAKSLETQAFTSNGRTPGLP